MKPVEQAVDIAVPPNCHFLLLSGCPNDGKKDRSPDFGVCRGWQRRQQLWWSWSSTIEIERI